MSQRGTLRARRHQNYSTVPVEVSLMNQEASEDLQELEEWYEYEEMSSPFAVRNNPTREELEAIQKFH